MKMLQLVSAAAASMSIAATASAIHIGAFTSNAGNAVSNLNVLVASGDVTPFDGADSWSVITEAGWNSMSTADRLLNYDTVVVPWVQSGGINFDWTTVLLPYLNGGGRVLWEDPGNLSDLAASGISLVNGNPYAGGLGEGDISLVAPFSDNGAGGVYHIHYGITGVTADWNVWSTDIFGGVHGVYREFANGGRMVLGVSDNLYHAVMSSPADADHFNLAVNQLNWLNTGSVDGTPVPDASATLVLLGLFLGGLGFVRGRLK